MRSALPQACNAFRLFNGKAAETELAPLREHSRGQFDNDLARLPHEPDGRPTHPPHACVAAAAAAAGREERG